MRSSTGLERLTLTPAANAAAGPHPADCLILALDRGEASEALALVAAIPALRRVKVGLELFTAAGPQVVERLRERDLRVFLDLKFHDIPATMAGACRSAARLGAELITVHASAGREALRAAQEAAQQGAAEAGLETPPTLLAVTVLTSWDPMRFEAELGPSESLPVHARRLADLAASAGLGGAVCSPLEVAALRAAHPRPFVLVTPGIRPGGGDPGDQRRVMTPGQAMAAGASALVIGRPIREAGDPAAAFEACCGELLASGAAAQAFPQ